MSEAAQMEVGSVAELVSAFGSVSALFAAGIAARAAIRGNRNQARQIKEIQERERRRLEEVERDQASKVAVWFGLVPESGEISIRYGNVSSQPVFDVDVFVMVEQELFVVSYFVAPPNSEKLYLDRVNRVILASFEQRGRCPDWGCLADEDRIRTGIGFRDANDNWWTRDLSGHLDRAASREDIRTRARALHGSLVGSP